MRSPRIFKNSHFGFTLPKPPFEMSKVELVDELTTRIMLEKKLKREANERTLLIHELEMHQLELEIQNRELLESHKQIEESRNKYAELYDLSPAGHITLDHKGRIVEINLTAAKLLKEEKSKLIGKALGRWISSNLKRVFMHHLQDVITYKEKQSCEIEVTPKGDSTPTHLKLHTQIATDTATLKPIYRLAVLDISDNKKALALEDSNRDLYDEKSLRENFVSHLSHDLRTPLTSSKLCAQMLSSVAIETGKRSKLLQMLVEELDRADRMVSELLNANKINGGKDIPLIKKNCDLDKVTRKCIEYFSALYTDNVKVNYRVSGEVTGVWSKDALQRIIENLMNNALKYGDGNSALTVSLEGLKDKVIMTIHNFGPPISTRDQKKIFEAFHRTQDAEKGTQVGWGLGLNLVHKMVRNHSGTINVTSSAIDGTSFIIELPKKA
ncbi:MAG TPA: PAS domain-containing sensor histidine kinase [Bacteriovoracaceae bacterium]|nr:PAS domain-containing sensor histidine kinase [Bacteriovoracaceae bacterium]